MKKRSLLIVISLLLSISLLFCACKPADNGTPTGDSSGKPAELTEGVITYEDATCESIKDKEDSGTVATAVASNGAPVRYTLDAESVEALNSAFGGALSIAEDGTIKGSYNATKKRKINITASAEKCESVTAEITISVINPYLDFEGRQLADARQGVVYAASVAFVTNEDVSVRYTIPSGSRLPDGLSLSEEGIISGIPTTVGRGVPFFVRAAASGFTNTEREFFIDVVINHQSETPSRIVNFGKEGEVTEVQSAFVGVYYVNQSGVAGNASALNDNAISYELAEGTTLPEGLTLYPNGAIFGLADTRTEQNFKVTATADHCDPVTREFKIEVKPQKIKFESISGTLTRGEAADFDIAKADAGEGIELEYVMNETEAASLRTEYGIQVTPAGRITGTPTKITELVSFEVTAQAEGFTPTTATIYLTINEPLQAPANGRFEAEYINLKGKNGTGYSSSPEGKDMIDTNPPAGVTASNGAFINYMFNASITLEFVIYAEEAASNVKLYAALGSEFGTTTLTPTEFGVYTYEGEDTSGTKTTINYGSARVDGGDHYTSFNEYQLGTVNLVQGWNVIQLAVHDNELRGPELIGGPAVDYIRLDTTVTLKWIPLLYNVSR